MLNILQREEFDLAVLSEKTQAYAMAFENRVLLTAKRYIESLYYLKIGEQKKARENECRNNPFQILVDLTLPIALEGYDIEQCTPAEKGLAYGYLEKRNLIQKENLPNALRLVDYLDYDDIVSYLRFFTHNSIEGGVAYGDTLARYKKSPQSKRMDGTPLPVYPPPPKKLPNVKVTLHRNTPQEDADSNSGKMKP
jgi:hypothetical protein